MIPKLNRLREQLLTERWSSITKVNFRDGDSGAPQASAWCFPDDPDGKVKGYGASVLVTDGGEYNRPPGKKNYFGWRVTKYTYTRKGSSQTRAEHIAGENGLTKEDALKKMIQYMREHPNGE